MFTAVARSAIVTRQRILDAALVRFSGYGFRRTSMEDIAGEAGVSRATLYLQFANKEAIFRSLSQALHQDALARAAGALEADRPLDERLRAAVEGLSLRFVGIVHGSPHGGELLDERNRLCGDLAADMDRRFRDVLTRAFRRAARSGEIDLATLDLGPADMADLFARSVSGLKGPGVTVDGYRKRLAALVRVFAAGLGGPMPHRRPRERHARRDRRSGGRGSGASSA
jgi:AcrR family transcriptional regulator